MVVLPLPCGFLALVVLVPWEAKVNFSRPVPIPGSCYVYPSCSSSTSRRTIFWFLVCLVSLHHRSPGPFLWTLTFILSLLSFIP